ncbi:hypothetical protein D9M68_409480 [compost metagenome]
MRNEQQGLAGKHNRLYKTWHAMLSRCNNPEYRNYRCYGGRGITVCDEWLSFPAFLGWALENGYASDRTLDRVDNSSGYRPDNCRWATPKEQSRNTRQNTFATRDGITRNLSAWAEIAGIPYSTFVQRLRRMGWPIQRAMDEPVHRRAA